MDARRPDLVTLSHSARAGDAPALERLLAELHPHVSRFYGQWLFPVHTGAAEDLAQQALIRIAGGLGGCAAPTDQALLAWCRTIARNVGLDHCRARRDEWEAAAVVEELAALPGAVPGTGEDPSPGVRLLLGLLREAHAAEAEPVHALLWHRLTAGSSWEETGAALGLTPAAAKRRCQRDAGGVPRRRGRGSARDAGRPRRGPGAAEAEEAPHRGVRAGGAAGEP